MIGKSGSGKGTQAKLLMEHFGNLHHISSGDLFRALSKVDTDASVKIKELMESGGLPSANIAAVLWSYYILFNIKADEGILTDGFPRRAKEAVRLDEMLDLLKRKENTFCILIDVSREECFGRLTKRRICTECERLIPWVGKFKDLESCDKCGGKLIVRADDNIEAINNRLDYYEKDVITVVEYYEKLGRLIKVNGEQSIEDVFEEILKILEKYK